MKVKLILVLLFFLLFSGTIYASNDAGAFLRTGIGARALSMGGSQVVSGVDGVSGYWNPAKLGLLKGITVDTMYGNKFDLDLEYSFVGFASDMHIQEKNIGSINVIFLRQGIKDIPKSTSLDINNRPVIDGSFQDIDQAL